MIGKQSIQFNSIDISNLDESKCDIVTSETVEQLINEIGKIKTQMNNTELQLYEANEKIAELIENVSTYFNNGIVFVCAQCTTLL